MGFFDPAISIPRVTYARLTMLVNEVSYLQEGEELTGFELRDTVDRFVGNILTEYVRQHFDESTKTAAEMIEQRRKRRRMELME